MLAAISLKLMGSPLTGKGETLTMWALTRFFEFFLNGLYHFIVMEGGFELIKQAVLLVSGEIIHGADEF